MKQISIALMGNPNVGKSTIFNGLTGANQHVGNWPGKTIERKDGRFQYAGYQFNIVDLPGTYSLTAFSPEEAVARDFIIQEKPDIILLVADAANLERNLYLTVQILEMQIPAILLLNMVDVANHRGYKIDLTKLSEQLQLPVLTAVARKEEGLHQLKETLITLIKEENSYVTA